MISAAVSCWGLLRQAGNDNPWLSNERATASDSFHWMFVVKISRGEAGGGRVGFPEKRAGGGQAKLKIATTP
jgi:hypothetical protein